MHVNGVASVIDESIEEVLAQSLEHGIEELLKQIGIDLLATYNEE